MQLHQIREARAAKVTEARSLLASMPNLTPEAQTKFDAIKAEIVNLEGQEARAQFVEDAERRALGTPVDTSRRSMEREVNVLDAIAAQIENRSVTGALAEFQSEAKRQGLPACSAPLKLYSLAQMTNTDRVIHDGTVYQIESVIDVRSEHRELHLMCNAVG